MRQAQAKGMQAQQKKVATAPGAIKGRCFDNIEFDIKNGRKPGEEKKAGASSVKGTGCAHAVNQVT
jgi:hypothetical protein